MEPEDWEQYLVETGISSAKIHAVTFVNEKLSIGTLQMLDRAILKELGVISMGEVLCILKQSKEAAPQATYAKAPTAKLPQLNLEMTPQQFRKFRIEWEVFVKITHHHHHVVLVARISLTLSRHFSLSFITSGRSSGQHPISSHSC